MPKKGKGRYGFTYKPPLEVIVTPPGGGDFLVHEVASDSLLHGHPDVIWYPDFTSLQTFGVGGRNNTGITPPYPGSSRQLLFFNNEGADPYPGTNEWFAYAAGYDGNGDPAIVSTPWGANAIRTGSQYPGGPSNSDGSTIFNPRKWFNTNTQEPNVAFHTSLGNTPLTDLYCRYHIMVESDVETGHNPNQGGCKLFDAFTSRGPSLGLNVNGAPVTQTQWYKKPVAGAGRVELRRYDIWASMSGSHDQSPAAGAMDVTSWLNYNQWHCIEVYCRLNTAFGALDGEYRIWLDDAPIFTRTNVDIWKSLGSFNVREHNHFRAQIYMGGNTDLPLAQEHHRIAGICIARRRIGSAMHFA